MTTNERLIASKPDALAAKADFQSRYEQVLKGCAVGLGLNAAKDAWALKVYARSSDARSKIPHEFRDFPIDVEVTGRIVAY